MKEGKNAYYYFEKLKEKGLNEERYYAQSLSPINEENSFPDEKAFMNWIVDSDFMDLRTMNEIIFSVYSNPSSEENIVINRYIKEENKQEQISKLSDECTENVLYLLKVLTDLKSYTTEDLIKIHEDTFDKIDRMKESLNDIINGAFEYFKKKEKQGKKEQYIG
jgi:hypothetical protein